MTRALVLFHDDGGKLAQIARSIYTGAQTSGAEAVLLSYSQMKYSGGQPLENFDLLFVEADFSGLFRKKTPADVPINVLAQRNVAVFGVCSNSHSSKQAFKDYVSKLETNGAHVKNTLMLHLKGPLSFAGNGSLDEIDFVRADAFGERTTNYFTGRRVKQFSEKAKIAGYRK